MKNPFKNPGSRLSRPPGNPIITVSMKKTSPKLILLGAALVFTLPILSQIASAQTVLFSDDFNGFNGVSSGYPAGGPQISGADDGLTNPGRIGGTLAGVNDANGLDYINGFNTDGNEQVGSTGTLTPDNLDNNVNGDNLLLANVATDFINYDFSTINGPIAMTFNGNVDSGDNTDWFSVMFGASLATVNSNPFLVNNNLNGILFRMNGGTQLFDHGNAFGSSGTGAAIGDNTWQRYEIILSDSTGTGSAFDGNGTLLTYYEDGKLLGSQSFAQLAPGTGYLGFGVGSKIAGIDDIVVSESVPPASIPDMLQDISPVSATVAVDSNAVFTAAFSNSPPVSIQWQAISGSPSVTNNITTGVVNVTNNGVVTSTLTLNALPLAASGTSYQVEAINTTNSAAVVYSSVASLAVISPITWYASGAGNGVFSTDSVLGFAGTTANEVYGVDFGGSGAVTTDNGYSFDDYAGSGNMSLANSSSLGIVTGYEAGNVSTGDLGLDTILEYGLAGPAICKGTLNNLTVGQAYTVLVLMDDTRVGNASGPAFDVTDGLTTSPSQRFAFPNGSPAVGGFIMGTFTAQSTNEPLTVLANGSAQYMAVLLEKGTAPAPIIAPTLTQDVNPLVSKLGPGSPVTLTVAASGSPLNYQWSNQNGPISGATSASYTFDAPAGPDSYNTNSYYCTVTNAIGGVVSSTAQVISSTNIVSVYNFSFEDNICSAPGANLNTVPSNWTGFNESTGNGDFGSEWNGGIDYTAYDPMAAPADGNQFCFLNMLVSGVTGGIYQDVGALQPNTTYTLTVAIGSRNDRINSPGIISLLNGADDTGTLLATTNALPATQNTWQDYTITYSTGPTVSGDLTVELSVVGAGTIQADFDNVQLTRAVGPSVIAPSLVTDISPLESRVTTGTPLTFTVAATGYPLDYQWYNQNGPISGATSASYSFDALDGTNSYYVTVTNTAGALMSATAVVISAPSIVTVNNYSFDDQVLTPGEIVVLTPNGPTGWNGFNVGLGGNYDIGLTYANGSDFTDPLTAPASGNNYLWINRFNGNGTQVAGIYQDVGALKPNTTYTLTVAIGQRASTGPNGSWSPGIISLLNGTDNTGTVLATGGGLPGTANSWQNYTVSFTTGATVSGDLTVELSVLDAGSIQADFGSVELTQSSLLNLNNPVVSGGNLILTASGGTANSGYTLLTTTNLLSPWTTNSTGSFSGTGVFSNSIPIGTGPARFFLLRTP